MYPSKLRQLRLVYPSLILSPAPSLPALPSLTSQGLRPTALPAALPYLPFQALDAIERAQDLAEEVGNKVRPDSICWVWSQEPRVVSRLWELVMDKEAWHAEVHGITKSQTST